MSDQRFRQITPYHTAGCLITHLTLDLEQWESGMEGYPSRAEKNILLGGKYNLEENSNDHKHNYIIDEVGHLGKNRISTSSIQ